MGLFAKLISYTPFGNMYKEYNQRKWERVHQKNEQQLFPARIAFYNQFLNPGDMVFDVGANVGNRVEVFLKCHAKVIAVEPQPKCVSTLQKKFGDKIIIEQVGLSDQPGELEMHIASDSTVSTFDSDYINETKDKFKFTDWKGTIKVPVTTLQSLIEKYGTPKFCKIDVEGFELHVLRGLKTAIPFLSIEYIVPERTTSARECVAKLHEISPAGKFNYSIGESMQWALPEWVGYDEFQKHILTEAFNKTSFGDIYFSANV